MARKKNFDESEVLDKALKIFWTKGFNATSIQDLVDGLGINRASMYDTWGDKHNLYMKSLERYRQNASSQLLNEIRSNKSALDILKGFLKSNARESALDPEKKGCFMINSISELANSDDSVNELTSKHRKTFEGVLAEIIREGQESGEIQRKFDSEVLARFLYSTVSGIRVIGKGTISEKELAEVVEVALSALD